jgi:hypothetical protein
LGGNSESQQAVDALCIQAEENFSVGEYRRIGQILLDQGLIDRSQLEEILSELEKIRKERAE